MWLCNWPIERKRISYIKYSYIIRRVPEAKFAVSSSSNISWEGWIQVDSSYHNKFCVFSKVPVIYFRLVAFWNKCSLPVNLCFQRYSVAVYLVRVFTAADLFSQLKLCSVESAERCRERSKCCLYTVYK